MGFERTTRGQFYAMFWMENTLPDIWEAGFEFIWHDGKLSLSSFLFDHFSWGVFTRMAILMPLSMGWLFIRDSPYR
jgi:hypothetical protein